MGYFQKQPLDMFCKKGALKYFGNFKRKHLCRSLKASLLKKDSNTVFSCQYCKIFKSNYSEKHLRRTASSFLKFKLKTM